MLKTTFTLLLTVFVSAIFLSSGHAAQNKNKEIEKNIAQSMRIIPEVPGIAVAVYSDDFTFSRGFGITSINSQDTVTDDTAFYIASATKSITALAMANLHEKGDIDLDASIASFSPSAPFPEVIETNKITLRQLLSQASGIKNQPIAHRLAYTGDHTPMQLWNALAYTENDQDAPRGSFRYSNYNYNILTILTDEKVNRSWKDIIAQDIFAKAGMTRTTAYVSTAKTQGWSIARPHQYGSNGVQQIGLEKRDNTMQSAGGVLMSANDAALWLELLVERGKVGGQQVVPANAVVATQQFETKVDKTFLDYKREFYGLGFYGGPYGEDSDLMLHHFGSFAGSSAHVSYIPNKKVGVAIFANNDDVGIRFATILSHYIYRELGNVARATNTLRKDIDQLAGQIKKQQKRLESIEKKHAERQYQLSLPISDYAGMYVNERYGNILISDNQQHLEFKSGNLSAITSPYPERDAVRVEVLPGIGRVLAFSLDADHQVESLAISSVMYTKVVE